MKIVDYELTKHFVKQIAGQNLSIAEIKFLLLNCRDRYKMRWLEYALFKQSILKFITYETNRLSIKTLD